MPYGPWSAGPALQRARRSSLTRGEQVGAALGYDVLSYVKALRKRDARNA